MYADVISAKGADNCFGFIDGTVRAISKPGERSLHCQMASLVTCMAQLVRNNHMYTLGRGEYEYWQVLWTYTPLSASLSPFWFAYNGNFNFQLETSE